MREASLEEPILSLVLQICQKNLDFLKIGVGEKRPTSQLLFFAILSVEYFRMYSGSSCGKENRTKLAPHAMVEKCIHNL